MFPHIFFKGSAFPVGIWDVMMSVGFIGVMAWAIAARPDDFPISRWGIFFVGLLLYWSGIIGTKLLWIYVNRGTLFGYRHLSFAAAYGSSGYAFLGSVPAQLLAMLAFTKLRERRISFWQVMDYATPFLLLHQAAVRIGCFCRGCCSGKPTNLPWGCHFQGLPTAYHPTQLYEIAYIIAIFAFMRRIYKKGVPNGEVFFATIGLYGVARFFNEFFRPDSPVVFWVINQAQLGLISMVSVCAIALLVITKEGGKDVG